MNTSRRSTVTAFFMSVWIAALPSFSHAAEAPPITLFELNWSFGIDGIKQSLSSRGFVCSTERDKNFDLSKSSWSDAICKNGDAVIRLWNANELEFNCNVFDVCELSLNDLAQSLVNSVPQISELKPAITQGVSGVNMTPTIIREFCGSGGGGDKVCAVEREIVNPQLAMFNRKPTISLRKGSFGKPAPDFGTTSKLSGRPDTESTNSQNQEANASTTDSASNVQKLSVKSVPTPYGTVSIDDDNRLLLNGALVSADIEANNSLDIEASVSLGTDSVVLITNYGGSACRALYRWVSFGKSGTTVTDEFGTCSDLAQPTLDGNKLVIRLPREREDTTLEYVKYEFDGKELTESVEK